MRGAIVFLLGLVLALGCNYKKSTDITPPLEVPKSYSVGDEAPATSELESESESDSESEPKSEPATNTKVEAPSGVTRDVRWWRRMGDPTLSALIEEALRRNQSVRAGWAKVQQARYIANLVRAARMPQIGAAGSFTAAKNITPFAETKSLTANGSLPVSYEVDLFARRAREHQGAVLDAEAARLDQEALAIAISAEVAEAWFDAINARIEVAVVQQQLDTDLQFLDLVELRYREGLNSAVDVHQQRQRVASQRALLAVSAAQIELTDQRLSVLLGEAPGRQFPLDGTALPEIGPTPTIEVPASLLDARPDIQAVKKRVEAEDRRVAAAVGARLPQVTIEFTPSYTWLRSKLTSTGAIGGTAGLPTEPITAKGLTWSAGGGLVVPLFDGLAGVSDIRSRRAAVDALLEQYAETILTALLEVESSLVLERQGRTRIGFLEDEFRLADITLEATRDRYRAGLSDFLPVLTALATRQVSELTLVAARRQLVSYRVQLYRALGGAWPDEFGEPRMNRRKDRRLKWVLSIGVIAGALAVAAILVATKPEPPRADKPLEGTLVEVVQISPRRHDVELHAKGTVVPAMEVVLQSELGGRVIWQSPELVPGGRFKAGQPIVRIDPRDYELAVESYRSQMNQAKLELALESRRGDVAAREWKAFGEADVSEDQRALAQRKPQLESTKLALKAAQSALKKAQLDLSRATLRAPFNAMVVSESVDLGQLISPQGSVARLVGTDEYHVQVSVPVPSLRTVRARTEDAPGSRAKVVQRVGSETIERAAEVIRQLPDLDPGGSMARLLLSIDDPLGKSGELPLLLGSFVDVAIAAQPIDDAILLPRAALRNGRSAYVMNDENLLEIREVEIAWTEPDAVLVTAGLDGNDRIVTSRIATPVPNMLLRTSEQSPAKVPSEASELEAAATP